MNSKNVILDHIRHSAEKEARILSRQFARAASEQREELLAALEIEKWLAQSCDDCLNSSGLLS